MGNKQTGKNRLLVEGTKVILLLLLLGAMMLWLSGTFAEKVEPGPPLPRAESPPVRTRPVEYRAYPLIVDQVGSLRTRTQAQVSSRIMAQVKEILVREGDPVRGGVEKGVSATVMARLDDREVRARVRQASTQVTAADRAIEAAKAKLGATRAKVSAAEAEQQSAASDYRRVVELHKSQAATGQQLEHALAKKNTSLARFQSAQQEVEAVQREIERLKAQREEAGAAETEAAVMLSYTEIQAPFTGRVVKKMMEVGDMATPGQPLFFLEIPSQPELEAVISDSLVGRLKLGEEMDVHIDAFNRTLKGKLREITPRSDPATRTVLVKVALPPVPDLVNGLFGRLPVTYGEYRALVIPKGAVREVGQLHLVQVVDPLGHPRRRFVTLGQEHGDLVEILSGLKEKEEVVLP